MNLLQVHLTLFVALGQQEDVLVYIPPADELHYTLISFKVN